MALQWQQRPNKLLPTMSKKLLAILPNELLATMAQLITVKNGSKGRKADEALQTTDNNGLRE